MQSNYFAGRFRRSAGFLAIVLSLLMLWTYAVPAQRVFADEPELVGQVDIISVTDFHGNLVNDGSYGENAVAEVLAKNIENIQADALASSSAITGLTREVLFIGNGDLYQGTALSNMLQGKPVNELFSALNMDVMALGNHEFDWSLATLDTQTHAGSGYDIIAANLRYADTWPDASKRGQLVYPAYKTFEKGGMNIAVIGGLLSNAGPVISANMWKDMEFTNLAEEVRQVAAELKATGAYDLIIGSFHTGVSECRTVANRCGDLLDIIFAGHTHTMSSETYTTSNGNKVPIICAGYNGRGYANFPVQKFDDGSPGGLIVIPEPASRNGDSTAYYTNLHTTWNSGGYQILRTGSSSSGYSYEQVPDSMRSERAAAIVNAAKAAVGPIAGEILGHTDVNLVRASGNDYFLQNWATQALLNAVPDAKVAFMNSGGLRIDITAGDVTVGTMYSLMPFDNAIYEFEIDKADLKFILEQSLGGVSGVRVTGTLPFAGILFKYDNSKSAGNRVWDITWADGSYIDSNERFKILVPDFVATGGDNYTSFQTLGLLEYNDIGDCINVTGILLRDAFIDELKRYSPDTEMGTLSEHASRRTNTTMVQDFSRLDAALADCEAQTPDLYTDQMWSDFQTEVTPLLAEAAVLKASSDTTPLAAGFLADRIYAAIENLTGQLTDFELAILTTTDMHGRIYSLNPLSDPPSAVHNTFLKTSTVVTEQRAAYDGTLLIDAGDIIQGTAMTSYNVNMEGGENNPLAVSLRYIGYDVFVPGNHEYNYTTDVQQKFYDMLAQTPADLGNTAAPATVADVLNRTNPVPAVAANILNSETEGPAHNFIPYVVKEFTAGAKTFRVGVLGFENVNVPNWDPQSHYPDTIFSHKDNADQTYVYEWENYWKDKLRNDENCDIVIVASHSGFGSSTFNKENQMRHFIENTDGVDLVIGGHDHSPRIANDLVNKSGESVPFLNAGTSNVTKQVITLHPDGTFELGERAHIALNNRVDNDPVLQALMYPYYENALNFVQQPIGTLSAADGPWDSVNNFFLSQGDGYDLVQEAQLWAADADVSIASDVHRNNFYPGRLFTEDSDTATISLRNMYDLYQYDNNLLYGIRMSGPELLSWMEETAKYYSVTDEGVLRGSGYGLDSFYGINYEVYVGNPVGERIKNATYKGLPLANHTAPDIKVAVNSYRLSASPGNDSYGWWKATGLNTESDRVYFVAAETETYGAVGGSVPLIIGEYIKAMCENGAVIKPPRLSSQNYSTWTVKTEAWTAPSTPSGPSSPGGITPPVAQPTDEEKPDDATTSGGSSSAPPLPAALQSFPDSARISSWAIPYLEKLVTDGIMTGRTDGSLDPKGDISRAELTKMITLSLSLSPAGDTASFSDVQSGDWYKEYVDIAYSNGLIQGIDASAFAPNANISRQDLCVIAYRALLQANIELPNGIAASFSDQAAIAEYAVTAIGILHELGIISGRTDGSFDPAASITREEAAKILVGVMEYVAAHGNTAPATETAEEPEAVAEEAA